MALHDTWLACEHGGVRDAVSGELAAHRAASKVLAQLYPQEADGRFEAAFAAWEVSSGASVSQRAMAREVGLSVARALVARSLTDGSGRAWAANRRPPDFAGAWQPAWPLHAANPSEGMAGEWRPWVVPASSRYDPPPPPRPGSEMHRLETLEVLEVSRGLTAEQVRLAHAWHLDAGSVTPPGVWMGVAMAALSGSQSSAHPHIEPLPSAGRGEATPTALQPMAALAVALHDSLVACWRVKMREWSERPITAIRRELDPRFEPLLVTPGFPSYVSGHASASGAAAVVLAHFLPQEATLFRAQAEEAAASRLWGGIHFRCDNEEGLRLGQAIGTEVLERMTQRQPMAAGSPMTPPHTG